MWRGPVVRVCLVVAGLLLSCISAVRATAGEGVYAAVAVDDPQLVEIRARVAVALRELGERAGEPETPDVFVRVPEAGRVLSAEEARAALRGVVPKLRRLAWWSRPVTPERLSHALREPASVLAASVATRRASPDDATAALEVARDAANFLRRAQDEAGVGVFPFPGNRSGEGGKAFEAAAGFLRRAEKARRLDAVLRGGWIVDDADDGGLQFDNGECGAAVLDYHVATGDGDALRSARAAADWAVGRPIVRNWNYNSFSVYLLARAYRVTGEKRYLDAAVRKVVIGVLPGQLRDGPRAGRWLDPHNARPAYHYILLRGVAQLAAVLPKDDPLRGELIECLRLGLKARNEEFFTRGVANKDKAMETLLLVARELADERELLRETRSEEALDALARLVSEQHRRGSDPLGPREWCEFLAWAVRRAETRTAE